MYFNVKAILLLSLAAYSSAAPRAGKCNSSFCAALQDLYDNLPGMIEGEVNSVCDQVTSTIEPVVGQGIADVLNKVCKEFLAAYEPQIIGELQSQIQQQGEADNCQFAVSTTIQPTVQPTTIQPTTVKPTVVTTDYPSVDPTGGNGTMAPVVYAEGDCNDSPFCQALIGFYNSLPDYIDSFEKQMCDQLPQFLQGPCHTFADALKDQLVAEAREQIAEQSAQFGCTFNNVIVLRH